MRLSGVQGNKASGWRRAVSAGAVLSAAAACLVAAPPAALAAQGDLTRISVTTSGGQANGASSQPSISADGRYIAFTSYATNLVASDTNGMSDVFVRDQANKTTARVSVGAAGVQGNGGSREPAISSDGRYIAFISDAANLATGDTNNAPDIYLRDTAAGTTTRVSAGVTGASRGPAISGDGKVIAFATDSGAVVRNLATGTTTSLGSAFEVALSNNGRYVVWDAPMGWLYSRDLTTGQTVTVWPSDDANGPGSPRMSADGRYVMFTLACCNGLLGGYGYTLQVWDRSTGATREVASAGGSSDREDCVVGNACDSLSGSAISADGRVVLFTRPGDPIGDAALGAFASTDWLTTAAPTWRRVAPTDAQPDGAAISGDGRLAGFVSASSTLVSGDTNGVTDVFVRELWNAPTQLYRDTFTAADGTAWKSAWITTTANGSLTVKANAGRMAFSNVAGAYARAQLAGASAQPTADLLTAFQWDATSAGSYFNVYVLGSGGWLNGYRPRNGVGLELSPSSATVAIKRVINGTTTTLATTKAQTVGTGKQWMRVQAAGGQLRYRIWRDGQTEPQTWTIQAPTGATLPAGQLYLSLVRSGSATTGRSLAVDSTTLRTVPGP